MSVLAREFDSIFNSMSTGTWADSPSYGAYHQHTREDEILIEVPLVGMAKDNVAVDVTDNVLCVNAKTDTNSRYTRNFNQKWILTKDSDTENISAKLENGLLSVRIPRVKPAKKVINVAVV